MLRRVFVCIVAFSYVFCTWSYVIPKCTAFTNGRVRKSVSAVHRIPAAILPRETTLLKLNAAKEAGNSDSNIKNGSNDDDDDDEDDDEEPREISKVKEGTPGSGMSQDEETELLKESTTMVRIEYVFFETLYCCVSH